MENLRLKNMMLSEKKKKLQLRRRQETMGEELKNIDVEYQQIENSLLLKRIDESNRELLQLKRQAAKAEQLLNSCTVTILQPFQHRIPSGFIVHTIRRGTSGGEIHTPL